MRLTPPEEQSNINALSYLPDAEGLDASDFIDVINALSNIKKRDAEKEIEDQEKETVKEKKIFVDKEYVYETRTEVFIYRDGKTKSKR